MAKVGAVDNFFQKPFLNMGKKPVTPSNEQIQSTQINPFGQGQVQQVPFNGEITGIEAQGKKSAQRTGFQPVDTTSFAGMKANQVNIIPDAKMGQVYKLQEQAIAMNIGGYRGTNGSEYYALG